MGETSEDMTLEKKVITQTSTGLLSHSKWINIRHWKAVMFQHPAIADIIIATGLCALGLIVARNLLQPGFPPGVDTPTFLHMSWFANETIRGTGGLIDPYWYGGFPLFITYPPLSYTLVGILAAVPGTGLVLSYKIILLTGYIGIGLTTYILAYQVGNPRPWAAMAGILTMLAYPLLVTVGLWGWFSSVVALPLALLALAMLEKAYHSGRCRFALIGGACLGLAILAHHMTAFAMAMGLPAWVLFCYLRIPTQRKHLFKVALLFSTTAMITTVWWIIPWTTTLLEVGFQRETPGLWSFPIFRYLEAIIQHDLIGFYAYPTYLGLGLIVMGIGGTVLAMVNASRLTPYAILLVILVMFSLGEQANPLIKIRPLDGLDVARFQLYMVPIITIVGIPFIRATSTAIADLLQRRFFASWLPGAVSGLLVGSILGQALWDSAFASQKLFQPYVITPGTEKALDWFGEEEHQGKVLGVGFWHWDDFILPYYLNRAVVDGWHDEGAKNWRTVRRLRMMMWTGEIDTPQVHTLLGELEGRYIVIQEYYVGESPLGFKSELRKYPNMFSEVAGWGEVSVFERLPRQ